MISHTTARFRKLLASLPQEVQKQAKAAYALFVRDPYHPSLYFKRVHARRPVYAVRISRNYRALGVLQRDEIVWFWIGSHADYDKIVRRLRRA